MKKLLLEGEMEENRPLQLKSDFRYLLTKNSIVKWSRRAKTYFEGDIFQIVLSNRVEADIEGSLLTLTGY